MSAPAVAAPPDPWERFGWVMGVIWLVFLGFPLASALSGERHWAARAVAVAVIVVFAAVYVHGFVRLGRSLSWPEVVRWGPRYVAVLATLVAGAGAVVGTPALGMVTFVVALGMFVLPPAWGLGVFAVGVTVVAAVTLLIDGASDQWYLVAVVALVGIATLVVRVLDHSGARHRALAGELALAAERDRVARDVHDVLGHSLTVVTVKAELAERLVDLDPLRAKAELAEIRALSRQALAENTPAFGWSIRRWRPSPFSAAPTHSRRASRRCCARRSPVHRPRRSARLPPPPGPKPLGWPRIAAGSEERRRFEFLSHHHSTVTSRRRGALRCTSGIRDR